MTIGIKTLCMIWACMCMFSGTDAYVSLPILRRTHAVQQCAINAHNIYRPRIDYGTGYDPKNRPKRSESVVDILQRTQDMTVTLHRNEQSTPRREIDYGAGYDPKNRPERSESVVDILQRTQDMTMATRKYEDKTMPKTPPRGIDYGAGYDPKNRPSEYQHVQTHKHNSTLSHGVIVLKLFIESYENAQM